MGTIGGFSAIDSLIILIFLCAITNSLFSLLVALCMSMYFLGYFTSSLCCILEMFHCIGMAKQQRKKHKIQWQKHGTNRKLFHSTYNSVATAAVLCSIHTYTLTHVLGKIEAAIT